MSRKTNTVLIGLLGTILMGLSTWVIITLVELQVLVMMIQQELFDLDKVIGILLKINIKKKIPM